MLDTFIATLQADAGLLKGGLAGVVALALALLLALAYRRRGAVDALAERNESLARQLAELADEVTEAKAQARELQGSFAQAQDAVATHRTGEAHQLERVAALSAEVNEARQQVARLTAETSRLTEALVQERKSAQDKIALLQETGAALKAEFKLLAGQALKEQSASNRDNLDLMLKPLQDHIGKFQQELRQVHVDAGKDRAKLGAEIEALTKRSAEMSKEAEALTKALKGDTQRQGAWGEMVLSRILENSGLREGQEYETQAHQRNDEGRALRPDVIVHLPGGKRLVVDSKVSLVAYDEAVNAENDAARSAALKRHVASVRGHIDLLAGKEYHQLDDGAVDYVILFMPIEGALSEALRERGDLTSYAAERAVMIATPTTLMMTLRTIENVWSVEKRNRNAEEIAKRAGLMYEKMAGFVGDLEKVGEQLDRARASHAAAVDKLSRGRGNLIGQFETMKQLGARTSKDIGLDHDEALPALEEE